MTWLRLVRMWFVHNWHKQTLVAWLLFSSPRLIQRFLMISGLAILFHRNGRCWQFGGWFPSLKLGGREHALSSVAKLNPCWSNLRGADESSARYFRISSGCAVLFSLFKSRFAYDLRPLIRSVVYCRTSVSSENSNWCHIHDSNSA